MVIYAIINTVNGNVYVINYEGDFKFCFRHL